MARINAFRIEFTIKMKILIYLDAVRLDASYSCKTKPIKVKNKYAFDHLCLRHILFYAFYALFLQTLSTYLHSKYLHRASPNLHRLYSSLPT